MKTGHPAAVAFTTGQPHVSSGQTETDRCQQARTKNVTVAFWCVLVAGLLPYAFAAVSKAGDTTFDNRRPRDWYQTVTGYRRRAWWEQQKSFEAFQLFASAVCIALVSGGRHSAIHALAIGFIAFRP